MPTDIDEEVEVLTFENIDGVRVQIDADNGTLAYVQRQGYTRKVFVRGTVGWTEIGMHTRKTEHTGIVAFLRPDSNYYAWVLLHDGSWIHGVFHRFNDGGFSVA